MVRASPLERSVLRPALAGGRTGTTECAMKTLGAASAIWYREMLRFWRDRARVASTFGFPFVALFILGRGLMPLMGGSSSLANMTYVQFIFPGVVGMNVVMTSVMMGTSVVWDREFGFLKGALVTPVGRSALLLGKIAGGSTIATIQGLLLLIFAPWINIQLSLSLVAALLGLMLLISLALTAMGLAIAICIRSIEGFHTMMQFAGLGMVFLGGAFFPVQAMPTWMNLLMLVNPATYAIDLLRQTTFQFQAGGALVPPPLVLCGYRLTTAGEVLVIAALGLAALVVDTLLFHRQE